MSSASACDGSRDRVGWAARTLIALVDAYRVTLAPLLGGHCRFWPSCSQYAQQAVALHGALAGGRLALARLLRCQPFHQGGFDPVPAPTERRPGTAPGGCSHSRS